MPRLLKVVVTGPFAAGKSQFIKTISDIPVVSTERKITLRDKGAKSETTVAMDYGRVALGDDILHLSGTPGQARFDFMWDILSREMHGMVVLVDSTDESTFAGIPALIGDFLSPKAVPYIVVANKQDEHGAVPLDKFRRALNLGPGVTLLPCAATQKTSVKLVLGQLAGMIQ